MAEIFQADHTGKLFSELVETGREPVEDLEFYEMVARKMLITRFSGQFYWLRRPHTSATFVEFPLSDDGETMTHFLEAMIW